MACNLLKAEAGRASDLPLKELYRTIMAGPGPLLADAFANLEQSPQVERVLRHAARDLQSARVVMTPDEGEGYCELTRVGEDLLIVLSDFTYRNPRFEFAPSDALVQFNFRLSGDLSYRVSRPQPVHFNHPSLHVWRQPHSADMRRRMGSNSHERWVTISVRPEFLVEHLLPSNAEVPTALHAFVFGPVEGSHDCQLPLTAQMIEITTKLIDNPYHGPLCLMYVEALALELLCFTVANFWSLPERPAEEYSEGELRALSAARRIITVSHASAPALREIARSVGLGEKTLEHGFKTVYGETLFDFGLRCRIHAAHAKPVCNRH
jgi:hypothetical protein